MFEAAHPIRSTKSFTTTALRTRLLAAAITSFVAAGTGVALAQGVPGHALQPVCDPDNGGLELPSGFCALVFHDVRTPTNEPARARHIAVAPNGDVFVAVYSDPGGVLALRDTDGDGRPDEQAMFGSGRGHGIAYREPYLYFSTTTQVERYLMSPETLTPVSGPEVIVSALPAVGDHRSKSIAVAGGSLFVNLGSQTDACQIENRVPGSPGQYPCAELTETGGIWRYDADQSGQTHTLAARYATGARNTVALAANPGNGGLYGVQHGRDGLNTYWPELFTPEDQANLPAEEFFRFTPGSDHGWPYCYYDGLQHRKVLAPEYGGDGTIQVSANLPIDCAAAEQPIYAFPAHWAPNALLFYTGPSFPARYQGGAFVAFHGSWNRPVPFRQEGYNVVFLPFRGGAPSSDFEVFADGFTGGAQNLPDGAAHRPTGLAQGPDGSLYITDDRGGRIWRVLHASRRR